MAANKFATMVYKNTNKITLILIYAVLEWTLITLLLLNSLFSYLIIKFADYFGLKPPCLLCSRVDHIFEPNKKNSFHRDLLCEFHASEISKLGYCSNHQNLAESHSMCEDCLSSRPDFSELSKNIALFPFVKENHEENFKCSCCEVKLENNLYSSYILIKPSWDALEYPQKSNLISEVGNNDSGEEDDCEELDKSGSDLGFEQCENEQDSVIKNQNLMLPEVEKEDKGLEEEEESKVEETPERVMKDQSVQVCFGEEKEEEEPDSSFGIVPQQHLEFFFDYSEKEKYAVLESMEMEEDENSLVFHAKECYSVSAQSTDDFEAMEATEHEEKNSGDAHQLNANETDAEVSIGTEIPDLDATDDIQNEDIVFSYDSNLENPSTSSAGFNLGDNHDEHDAVELRSLSMELNGIEEEKVPDTPTSIDSLNSLHKKLLLLEKKDSGTEDSLDGSIISEIEGGDGVATVERLKSVLRNERKALQALYLELEEERSASAVAANQTMAMINRLQEEKAQMQMEALQYQRMMEEQSEYDQEALQLLNELMVKREKEKQELEKELEVYRRKVLEYETKEKMKMLRRSKDGSARSGFSSASCSNAEDSDGVSIDLNQEAKEVESFYTNTQECSSNHNTPVDSVLNLEESLADFEVERLSILEQLKVLEEKLMTLDEDEDVDHEQNFECLSPTHHLHEENGHHHHHVNGVANGHANGYSKEKNQQERRMIIGSKGKSLLPLFDAMDDENGDMIINGSGNGFETNGIHHDLDMKALELENKKLYIEEEVDHLFERLQALEADREFLKHCISSLKKGDKGMDLLQEILQHLRDLRNVELRAKNFTDGITI
ncbi:hypothetical protein M9H77_08774 [Catharanthus roseus]|uniref:Uncharacterized protein n=1 Tax=Catharanthus roseus TaxID=4058 RepID=A0ACC0BYR0_CATRO|nr:hypothetical protein M9H77_08774 [Catharanthus roseus]